MKKFALSIIIPTVLGVGHATAAPPDCSAIAAPLVGATPEESSQWMKEQLKVVAAAPTVREAAHLWLCFHGTGESDKIRAMGKKVCSVLEKVGTDCLYNHRFEFVEFLAYNGTLLFPASGGTNIYDTEYTQHNKEMGFPDNAYIGTGQQNKMLEAAILRNMALFKDGEFTIDDAKHWK